jgi:hypothetical protein
MGVGEIRIQCHGPLEQSDGGILGSHKAAVKIVQETDNPALEGLEGLQAPGGHLIEPCHVLR